MADFDERADVEHADATDRPSHKQRFPSTEKIDEEAEEDNGGGCFEGSKDPGVE